MAFNMDPKKCPMPTQDPNVRNKNFKEVALGYTEEMAVNEAKRCVHCKNKPCQTGTARMCTPPPSCQNGTATRWPSSALALPV